MSSPAQVAITTTPLYGVLVSRKSYLIGLRCHVKTKFAQVLAERVCAGRLPTELSDLIADELIKLECETVRHTWDLRNSGHWDKGWIGKDRRFRYWKDDKWDWTKTEKLAFEEVVGSISSYLLGGQKLTRSGLAGAASHRHRGGRGDQTPRWLTGAVYAPLCALPEAVDGDEPVVSTMQAAGPAAEWFDADGSLPRPAIG